MDTLIHLKFIYVRSHISYLSNTTSMKIPTSNKISWKKNYVASLDGLLVSISVDDCCAIRNMAIHWKCCWCFLPFAVKWSFWALSLGPLLPRWSLASLQHCFQYIAMTCIFLLFLCEPFVVRMNHDTVHGSLRKFPNILQWLCAHFYKYHSSQSHWECFYTRP